MNFCSLKRIIILILFFFLSQHIFGQIDSILSNVADTIKSKLILDDIPRKTFKDKFMYPHRWYVKQLLTPKTTDFDTTYIRNGKHRLTLTLPVAKKFYGFTLNDLESGRKLRFSPNTYYNIGFNFSNIILTFGFYPGIRFGAKKDHGYTISRDLQLILIGRRVLTDINYQNYQGFYLYNAKDYLSNTSRPDSVVLRPGIRAVSFGVNTMFIHNYKKYSLRGAFAFSDSQRKSAGSFMTGLYHSHTAFYSGDSSFTGYPFSTHFSTLLNNANGISVITVGLSEGYGYTLVWKKIIYCTSLNLGIGAQKTNYTTLDGQGHSLSLNLSGHLNAKAALRFDNLRFFTGIMASYDNNFTFNPEHFRTEAYIAKVVAFVGYRFNIRQNGRKVLKAMRLVDYKQG